MKKLHPLFLGCFATMLLVLSSCEVKDNTPCTARYTYHPLTDEEKSKTPYFNNPNFDTLHFLSSTGDTLTFALQSTDSSWYIEDANRNPNPDGCPDWQYYENLKATFKTNDEKHSLAVEFRKKTLNDLNSIIFSFNQSAFFCNDFWIGASDYPTFISSYSYNNLNFSSVIILYSTHGDSTTSKLYINNSHGIISFEDKMTSQTFLLINPH